MGEAVTKPIAGPADAAPARRISVLLPLPLAGPYDYRAPADFALAPGDFVLVPLGRREAIGVVWDTTGAGDVAEEKLRPVSTRLDLPGLTAAHRRFIDWVAQYTLTPAGAVLRMAMSVAAALEPPKLRSVYALTEAAPAWDAAGGDRALTPARRRVLRVLQEGPARSGPDLAHAAGVGAAVVAALEALGWIRRHALPEAGAAQPDGARPGPVLSADQAAAVEALRGAVADAAFGVWVLDGVTGSGKTEVYFEAIAAALAAGRQALVLLPEIALGTQWLARFEARFGVRPTAWHSDLRAVERRQAWRDVAYGRARVVVGARSALFLPFRELGLIVVDEEHDTAFKQEDGVIYHARDMAVVRARYEAAPVVLVSATPSLETLTNVERGRYRLLHLADRHGGATLPTVRVIDLRRHPPPRQRWLSPPLCEAVAARLAAGEQAMLFLNRRGYAPLTLCRHCGFRLQCPNCSTWLVEHRLARRLVCHHCGHSGPLPNACPACGTPDSLQACGPGVERLAEETMALFPEARVALATSDTLMGPLAAEAFMQRMAAREIDLLIGTQIVAKGHHFPHLTLVGVIDADLGLGGGDLRAGERTYQLLHQVGGRAGRAEHPGEVMLQTHQPEHPVMKALAAQDRDGFLAAESEDRRRHGWPPFGRLAAVIVSGRDGGEVAAVARALGAAAPGGRGVTVLGPAPAPLSLLRGRHRHRLLLKATREIEVQPIIVEWLARVTVPGGVRVQVDIDPYSFL